MVSDFEMARFDFYNVMDQAMDRSYASRASETPGLHEFAEVMATTTIESLAEAAPEFFELLNSDLIRKGTFRLIVDFSSSTETGFETITGQTFVDALIFVVNAVGEPAKASYEWSVLAPTIDALEHENGGNPFNSHDARLAFGLFAAAQVGFMEGMIGLDDQSTE